MTGWGYSIWNDVLMCIILPFKIITNNIAALFALEDDSRIPKADLDYCEAFVLEKTNNLFLAIFRFSLVVDPYYIGIVGIVGCIQRCLIVWTVSMIRIVSIIADFY